MRLISENFFLLEKVRPFYFLTPTLDLYISFHCTVINFFRLLPQRSYYFPTFQVLCHRTSDEGSVRLHHQSGAEGDRRNVDIIIPFSHSNTFCSGEKLSLSFIIRLPSNLNLITCILLNSFTFTLCTSSRDRVLKLSNGRRKIGDRDRKAPLW